MDKIFLAVMTSLFQGSWCLIGLIGIRHYSRVEHHVPQDLPKPTTAEHSVPWNETRPVTEVAHTHQSLLHSFRCEVRVLKSILRNPSINVSDAENLIFFCSLDSNEDISPHGDCRQSTQRCSTMTARQLLLEPGCSPISRIHYCLGDKVVSCFKSSKSVKLILRSLFNVCSRHRHNKPLFPVPQMG
ncbi:uncharacterized protein LOC125671041 [Ostrea edulis]|uniref:uncharacterized protein LOC125671041 n=1 Tax=Ostrea edulis TaxID=37623 RepID=UPI0020946F77|nr:uncharacterized protein LOC125671041 [Ostrea edulis]